MAAHSCDSHPIVSGEMLYTPPQRRDLHLLVTRSHSAGGPFKPGFGLSGAFAFAFLSVIPVGNLLLVAGSQRVALTATDN
jgi:hypothetical protein